MSGRTKRADKIITEFLPCQRASVMTIENCYGEGNLGIKCKFVQNGTCVYKVDCSLSVTGWNCGNLHRFTLLNCCDYTCLYNTGNYLDQATHNVIVTLKRRYYKPRRCNNIVLTLIQRYAG